MKKTLSIFLSVLAVSIILPSIVLAAWWNPFTWNIWKFFPQFNKPVKTEVINVATTTSSTPVINQASTTSTSTITLATTTKAIGMIKKVYQKDGKYYLDIDYIESLYGMAAVKANIEDKKCLVNSTQTALKDLANYGNIVDTPESADFDKKFSNCIPPDGIYDRNNNPLIRTFEISNNVGISTVYIYTSTTNSPELHWEIVNPVPMSLVDFYKYFNMDKSAITYGPYNIEVKDNIVTKIDQQFRP